MDAEKRKELETLIRRHMDRKEFPGFLLAFKTADGEDTVSCGLADPAAGMKMERDTIFRLYSMSKPVCAVAVWILIERGKLSPEDLLTDYLPEFRDMTRYDGDRVVPVRESVRIRHLLNMTAGFTYDEEDAAGRKMAELFEKLHKSQDDGAAYTTRQVMRLLAKLPLAQEPGSAWRYGLCADVLGAVIEVVDGRSLGEFYREEIFEPLGMKDTGFFVPREKQDRFAPLFRRETKNGVPVLEYDREHHLGLGDFLAPPAFESAGAGLVSTCDDYMRFAWMLAKGGELGGVRILKRETVGRFQKNGLTPAQTETVYYEHMRGYGYGNLLRVCLDEEEASFIMPAAEGSFGWDGWSGPYMAVDQKHEKALVFFVQICAYADRELTREILRLLML